MMYTMLVTLKVAADSEHEAYRFVRHALDSAKKAELLYLDSEVTVTEPEEEVLTNRAQGDRQ